MIYNPYLLTGKNILVTGASSGIGKAIAIECAKMGATVFITGRNQERLNNTLNTLDGEGHKAVVADLSTTDGIKNLVGEISVIDGFVSSAGVNKRSLCRYLKNDDMQQIMDVNLFAPISLTKMLLKEKKINKSGSVVFLASIAAFHSSIGDGIYSASKGGLVSFSRVLALELAPMKIRVNTIQPGMVRTEMLENGPLTEDDYFQDEKKYPLARYGKPEEVAYAAIYLLSDATCWMTGSGIILDGGISLI